MIINALSICLYVFEKVNCFDIEGSIPKLSLYATVIPTQICFQTQFTRDEFQQNYQRLVKEHMELENSYRLLQVTHGASYVDPQREEKVSLLHFEL